MHLILHFLGLDSASGTAYLAWSGVGGDVGLLAAAAAFTFHAVVSYRHKNCEVHRCWRLGRHTTAAGHHLCRRHHPDDHLTAEQVHLAHHAALAKGDST